MCFHGSLVHTNCHHLCNDCRGPRFWHPRRALRPFDEGLQRRRTFGRRAARCGRHRRYLCRRRRHRRHGTAGRDDRPFGLVVHDRLGRRPHHHGALLCQAFAAHGIGNDSAVPGSEFRPDLRRLLEHCLVHRHSVQCRGQLSAGHLHHFGPVRHFLCAGDHPARTGPSRPMRFSAA